MTDHMPMAALCASCRRTFEDRVAGEPTKRIVNALAWCSHLGVLAVCQVQRGGVRTWMLHGPITAADANATLRQLAETVLVVAGAAPDGTLQ